MGWKASGLSESRCHFQDSIDGQMKRHGVVRTCSIETEHIESGDDHYDIYGCLNICTYYRCSSNDEHHHQLDFGLMCYGVRDPYYYKSTATRYSTLTMKILHISRCRDLELIIRIRIRMDSSFGNF